jgi:hypothetical protein
MGIVIDPVVPIPKFFVSQNSKRKKAGDAFPFQD